MTTSTTTSTITLAGNIKQRTTTRSLNVTLIPWMRSRKVFFKIEGLLPNMKHRPYFDGVDVSAWCREETFQFSSGLDSDLTVQNSENLTEHPESDSDLISDASGTIEGSFYIPNTDDIRFRTGAREFKVLDWLATSDSNAISKAFAQYTARGTLETLEREITTILPPPPVPPVRRIDPIAQSFVVDSPVGIMVTSVDVFMATKSSTVPLRVQIRPVINGSPAGYPIAGASKFISASDVNVSQSPSTTNSDSITTCTFDAPVYLDGGREYAVVLLAETDDYTAWTAVMTEFQVNSTSKRILKQPSMGSFFKSQNGSTWTPDQSRDLMFRIKRANFDTAQDGVALFENVPIPAKAVTEIEVTEIGADPIIRISQADHNMFAGSTVLLSGSGAFAGIAASAVNTTHTIVNADDPDSYTIQLTGSTSTADGWYEIGGNVVGTHNKMFNVLFTNVNQMVLSDTSIEWSLKSTSGQSFAGDEIPYAKTSTFAAIDVNDNISFVGPQVIASGTNETVNMGSEKSFTLKAVMKTSSKYVSPVIDLSRVSASLIANRVDNQSPTELTQHNTPARYVAETDATGGSSLAKQVFVPIKLEQSAVGLKILFSANRPATAGIDLYYRTAQSGSDDLLSNSDWTLASIDNTVQSDDDETVFREYEYTIDDLDDFDTYQIKMVFTTYNTSEVPQAKDFRAIALGT